MASPASALADAAQRLVLSLYEGGLLSPAVLERVIASVGGAPMDWDAIGEVGATDGRSIREIMVAVMMPGNPLDNVERDFAAVIEHITGLAAAKPTGGAGAQPASTRKKRPANAAASAKASEAEDDDALLAQLSGAKEPGRKRASSPASGKKPGFNLSNNAVPPKRSKAH